MGVDKEVGFTMSTDKYNHCDPRHFLLEDIEEALDFGEGCPGVYAEGDAYQVLAMDQKYVQLCVNSYGEGRSVYFAGLPYSPQNCRLLLRALYFAAGRESLMKKFYVSNVNTEIAAFEEGKRLAIINNSEKEVSTDLYIDGRKIRSIALGAMQMLWTDMEGNEI